MLVYQIKQEPVADRELKDTLEEVYEANLGRGRIDMLVATCRRNQESNVVAHI